MNRGLILVEGQTEQSVVRDLIRPHLQTVGLDLIPTVLATRRVKAGPDFKGGISHYAQVDREVRLLLRDSSVVVVTTLLDYYGLPGDFPGMSDRPDGTGRADHVEQAFRSAIGHPRFDPHLVLHELEALAFADPAATAAALGRPALATELAAIRDRAGGPEAINEGRDTAPSRRLRRLHPPYDKLLHGPRCLSGAGLATIRVACPRFDGWLQRLEQLGA